MSDCLHDVFIVLFYLVGYFQKIFDKQMYDKVN